MISSFNSFLYFFIVTLLLVFFILLCYNFSLPEHTKHIIEDRGGEKMIKVEALAFSYADKKVLHDVSFTVKKGQVFAVLGQNGQGKTTLIKLMSGMLIPTSGDIIINSHVKPHSFNQKQRKLIGVMQEIKGIYLKMTAYEYLAFIGAMYGMSSQDINNAIDVFGNEYDMSDDVHRIINKYSSGMKKKLEFFAAIMFEPYVLFLDEPFESVDPAVQYEIKAKINRYTKSGGTLVITSHILESIQSICTNYVIIAKGRVAAKGAIAGTTKLEKIFMDVVRHE